MRLQSHAHADARPSHQVSSSPQHSAAIEEAVRVAKAGPAMSAVDLGALSQTEDPEALRRKLRQLMDERNELACKNWALQATNM